MATRKPKAAALEQFLAASPIKHRKCETCCESEEVQTAIQQYVDASAATAKRGAKPHSLAAFHAFMQKNYSYSLQVTALYNHINRCLKK